jgi:hypothetical protein
MGRHKRPSMIQVTRRVHKNATKDVIEFIKKRNSEELKKDETK